MLFPSDCRICGLPLLNISRLPVCPECLAGFIQSREMSARFAAKESSLPMPRLTTTGCADAQRAGGSIVRMNGLWLTAVMTAGFAN